MSYLAENKNSGDLQLSLTAIVFMIIICQYPFILLGRKRQYLDQEHTAVTPARAEC